jgi:TolB-like protein/DNA-binding SARP family transcriptional activator
MIVEFGEDTHKTRGAGSREAGLQYERAGVRLRLLGPLEIWRGNRSVPLPRSRKVRALLGYLALAPSPVARARLCDLLWDVANDPRGELRWCLTKVRALIDEPQKPRLISDRGWVGIDASGIDIDAARYTRLIEPAVQGSCLADLRHLVGMVEGELLYGLHTDRSPLFETWLAGQRHRFADWHIKALLRMVALLPGDDDEVLDLLRKRLALVPYGAKAHIDLLSALHARGLKAEADNHLASATRLLESEGLDASSLKRARARAKTVATGSPPEFRKPEALAMSPPADALRRQDPAGSPAALSGRASIAVMPFSASIPADSRFADGVTHDIIIGLARLRSLTVIARGTTFALRDRALDPRAAGELLGVRYMVSGAIHRERERLRIGVELSSCAAGHIVWADEFTCSIQKALEIPGDITTRIIAGVDTETHAEERKRAILKPPDTLDVWEAYHRGVWHMYRFRAADNEAALSYFQRALVRDPTFSRAHAGLSFTHFQNAFLIKSAADRARETDRAFEAAGRGVMADPLDPAAHWAMGRALWLRGEDKGSIRSLDEAVRLSPNFAMGHYALSFVHSQTGDADKAVGAAELSQQLSPHDPLLFAVCTTRAFGLLRLNRYEDAADWVRKGAQQPNAHVHIHAASALTLAAVGYLDEARRELQAVRLERPDYDIGHFLSAFRMHDELQDLYRHAACLIGLDRTRPDINR